MGSTLRPVRSYYYIWFLVLFGMFCKYGFNESRWPMLALGYLSIKICFFTSEILRTYGFLGGESSSNLLSSRFLMRLMAIVCCCYRVCFSRSWRFLGESFDLRYSSRIAWSLSLWLSSTCLIYSTLLVCCVGLGRCLSRVGSSRVRFTLSLGCTAACELFLRRVGVCGSLLAGAEGYLF